MGDALSAQVAMLEDAPAEVRRAFDQRAGLKRFVTGQILAIEGQDCAGFFVVTSGVIRVYKIGESGREVTLYRVNPQESCVLTAFAILSETMFPAIAIVESDVELLLVPSSSFREWVHKYVAWRQHVFTNLSRRLTDILDTIEKVTFTRVDSRIGGYLLEHADPQSGAVSVTHERIASDLGTSRVVVSRLLKDFERRGCVKLARGSVTIVDRPQLEIIKKKLLGS